MGSGTRPATTEDKRERTIETAREYFHKFGYRKASLSDLIGETGISKPTFYNYFKNKEELFFTVMAETYNEFAYQYSQKSKAAVSALEKLEIFVTTYSWFLDAYPIFRDLNVPGNDLLPRWVGSRAARDFFSEGMETVRSIIEQGIDEGLFDGDLDMEKASLAVYHMIVSALSNDPSAYRRKNGPELVMDPALVVKLVGRALSAPQADSSAGK